MSGINPSTGCLDTPREAVAAAWVERLDQCLARLTSPSPADVRDYVLNGEPVTVLAALSATKLSRQKLGLLDETFEYDAEDGPPALYTGFDQIPAIVALRWARVLEAAGFGLKDYCQLSYERGVRWPELLMVHSTGLSINVMSPVSRIKIHGLTGACLDAMCAADQLPPDAWLLPAFAPPTSAYHYHHEWVTGLPDYPQALLRHASRIGPLLLPVTVPDRVHVLKMLARAPSEMLDLCAEPVAALVSSASKAVRLAAEPLLTQLGPAVVALLQRTAKAAKPDVREQSLRVIATVAQTGKDAALMAFARETAAADKAQAVRDLIGYWDRTFLSGPTEGAAASSAATAEEADGAGDISTSARPRRQTYELPRIDWSASGNSVDPAVLARLWAEVQAGIDEENDRLRALHAAAQAQGRPYALRLEEPVPDRAVEALRVALTTDGPAQRPDEAFFKTTAISYAVNNAATKLFEEGHFTAVAMVKAMAALGQLSRTPNPEYTFCTGVAAIHRATGRPTLLELSDMLAAHGYEPIHLLRAYCGRWDYLESEDWPAEHLWPFFAHHEAVVLQVLNESDDWNFSRPRLFEALALQPAPSPALTHVLYDFAFGAAKVNRALAQTVLRHHPERMSRIIQALGSGKADVRAIAAQWLASRLDDPALSAAFASAVAALETAVRKEKNDVTKGAMLDALQALGRPVADLLDRDVIARDAAQLVAKGLPKELEWFPWASLPVVHWSDTQTVVPTEVLQWLLTQACKAKSPEPNAVLRLLCGLMVPRERQALGQWMLEAWLAEDVRPISPEEALARARAQAQVHWGSIQSYPQYYADSPWLKMSQEEITAHILPGIQRLPAGSVIGAKGVLALCAACCAERAAPVVQRYLKEWAGSRAAQGKALIAMLAWIDHPSATQLMLSVGQRFRTKSFQEEATRQAEALAERKGWTLTELADRTMPTAGFDETGTLSLNYGQREFTARLLPDFKVELFHPDGKKIAALPDPRQDDDETLAKDAKKALSAAKKEIKNIVELQTARLYEALCVGREWRVAEWRDYLLTHPVVRHLLQRLVWLETRDDGQVRSFRPLDDSSLTDVNDDPVVLDESARIRLAHDSLVGSDAASAWSQHLADYDIEPLFQQFGKVGYALPADQADATAVLAFRGHMVEAFALRNRAGRLGYVRGQTEDAGWFFTYEKRFPTLDLVAVVEFTGNALPETNRSVALKQLSFRPLSQQERGPASARALSKIPAVLLSECHDDLRLMAADGSGFDPEWEKKSEY